MRRATRSWRAWLPRHAHHLEVPEYRRSADEPAGVVLASTLLKWLHGAPVVHAIADMWPETVLGSGMLPRRGGLHRIAYALIGAWCRFLYRRASVVTVELHAHDAVLRLVIRDDGIGGADPGHGSGLLGLRDRIEALGGTLQVTSPAGNGTTLQVQVPLEDLSGPVSPEP